MSGYDIKSVANIHKLESEVLPLPVAPHTDRPTNPDFSFMRPESSNLLSRAYRVINQEEGWIILANFYGESFMFSQNPEVCRLTTAIASDYNCHSGSSMGWTMRQLENIAKNGFTSYRQSFQR
jgi:hypothetical protein